MKPALKNTLITIGSIIGILVIGNALTSYKLVQIPEEISSNIAKDAPHYRYLRGKKKIVWFGSDCPIGKQRVKMIDILLETDNLKQEYENLPTLVKRLKVTDDTLKYFVENCNENFCITMPETKQMILISANTSPKKLHKLLVKFQNW